MCYTVCLFGQFFFLGQLIKCFCLFWQLYSIPLLFVLDLFIQPKGLDFFFVDFDLYLHMLFSL